MRITRIITMPFVAALLILVACVSPATSPTVPEHSPIQQAPATPKTTPAPTPSPTPATIPNLTPSLTQALRVHFIDVGQGDSILIDLGEMEILIDGGDRSPGVVNYLRSYVDGALEVMLATHPHADHIGGLIAVLDAFQVQQIWHNGDTSESKTCAEFMTGVQSEGAEIHIARLHNTIEAGELKLFVHNPANLEGSTNNNSIVLHLAYGDIDFLFTGDAEKEAEGQMMILSSVNLPEVEILKVGHHGSRTASSEDFLAITRPEVAIYMAGSGNSYGHPHQETLITLNNIGVDIYGTDVHGAITVTTNGQTYDLQLEKQAPPIKPATVSPPPTPTQTPTPTPSPTPSPTPGTAVNVKITKIFYDGVVPRVESDEYVEITNQGSETVDLTGWVLKDISEGYPSFTFPSYVLQPSKRVRVYTNEIHPEYGGFSFRSGKAVWNNSSPDTAALYNTQGQEVSRKSY